MSSDILKPSAHPESPGAPSPLPTNAPPQAGWQSSSTSGDELSTFLAHPRPDPLLGEFVEDKPGERARRRGPGDPSNSADALRALGLETDQVPAAPLPSASKSACDEADAPRAPWGTILLSSYASAVTIALAWLLWSGRASVVPDDPYGPSVGLEAEADPGVHAGSSRRFADFPPPLPAVITALGAPVRLGEIEVTPLAVEATTVVLNRTLTSKSYIKGGQDALGLVLRFKNVSTDSVFTPLDEGFLRRRKEAEPDSFIEAGPDGPIIPLFPLAVGSELLIVGQDYLELGPGEEYETTVFTAPDVAANLPDEFVWRIRLRTGVGRTDVLGVRVKAVEVRRPEGER